MPQIDFRNIFPTQDDDSSANFQAEPEPVSSNLAPSQGEEIEVSKFRRSRLGRWGWANIIFAVTAIFGGLFCPFFLFNGPERLRAVAAWPHEFLFPHPSRAEDCIAADRSRLAASLGLPPVPNGSARPGDRAGDPFSRTPNSLSLNSPTAPNEQGLPGAGPASPASSTFPNPQSPLSQLHSSAPGGDALTQTLNRAATERANIAKMAAKRTVTVVKTDAKSSEKHVSSRGKSTMHGAHKTIGRTKARTPWIAWTARMARKARMDRTAKHGAMRQTANSGRSFANHNSQQAMRSARAAMSSSGAGVRTLRGDNAIRGMLSQARLGGLGGSPGGHGGHGGHGAAGGGRH
jgi:hypothetical protein